MRAIWTGLLLVILTSCNHSPTFSEHRNTTQYLASISPVRHNDIGIQVVDLNFTNMICVACDIFLDTKSAVWQVFPVDKISTDIIGKYVGKTVTLKYNLVRPQTKTQPPLVYITEFTVLK